MEKLIKWLLDFLVVDGQSTDPVLPDQVLSEARTGMVRSYEAWFLFVAKRFLKISGSVAFGILTNPILKRNHHLKVLASWTK